MGKCRMRAVNLEASKFEARPDCPTFCRGSGLRHLEEGSYMYGLDTSSIYNSLWSPYTLDVNFCIRSSPHVAGADLSVDAQGSYPEAQDQLRDHRLLHAPRPIWKRSCTDQRPLKRAQNQLALF